MEMQANFLSELNDLQRSKEDACDPLQDVFEFVEVGCNGEVDIKSRSIADRCQERKLTEQLSKLPNGLPPIFPTNHELDLEEYLIHPEKLPIHNFYESQRFWPRTQNPDSLFNTTFSPVLTELKVKRDPKTGQLLGYHEVGISNADCTGRNSTSLLRKPEPQSSDIKGNSTNIAFRPGGLDEPVVDNDKEKEEFSGLDFENDLLDVPPGFTQKVSFQSQDTTDGGRAANLISIIDILTGKVDFDDEDEVNEISKSDNETVQVNDTTDGPKKSDSLENLLVTNDNVDGNKTARSETDANKKDEEWAVIVNDPVNDFHTRVPEMARKWDFELDVFQKQAVIHLEKNECVFVAAHTSAGKTVVAEYAIALSERHMTKTIYTSPIKALSNQKFREFKEKFETVGLITGDIQINPEANCLVMTTEILRSMLYRGSRLIRDTEWVIFDEVHYVNDTERGVVWEEVLIMLPDHVGIIMLSATVPNRKEFAGWVGRIKKKKIYVISTLKRPVPLEHFLYTGNSSKTSNEMFLIVDRKENFLPTGHRKAVEAKSQRSKPKDNYGPKGTRSKTAPNEERNVWYSIIRKLEKDKGLPVVAFTFSRIRCNDNADKLTSLDLTTSKEKHEIHGFIQKCISRLKGQDKQLPQVQKMQDLLERGLAVHHSGILPILKEMIELLFQKGLVKVLFATETFAMGVNMPARTVVFDSIRKHDGVQFRHLLPGEFIQMSGRAGRRGLDDTGTVIILCKADVPEFTDIQKMMTGKPTLLESRFRLTYNMMLNLLRSEDLCVEDMMKRSFAEFHLLKNAPERERMISELTEKLEKVERLHCERCGVDVEQYYDDCKELTALRKSLQSTMISSPNGQKSLSPGRIIIITNKQFSTRFGMILAKKSPYSSHGSSQAKHANKSYVVLLPCDSNEVIWNEEQGLKDDEDSEILVEPYTDVIKVYCPERPCTHAIIEIEEDEIAVITDEVKPNVNAEIMINDFNKRKQPRFRNEPPGKTISSATEELLRLSETCPEGLPMTEFSIKDLSFHEQRTRRRYLETRIQSFSCVLCPSFEDHLKDYRKERILRDKIASLKEKSSVEVLTLIPEYRNRVKVLVRLGYINEDNLVQLKGRVACEISNHEIVIFHLIYERFFNELDPAEIVALLSCFVFEQKKCSEPNLTKRLREGKERILKYAQDIAKVEISCDMDTSCEEFCQQLKFGLVEVVYEWARGMPFNEITSLTDVQEGIIVRCIQRLNELCGDVKSAAKRLGVKEVAEKMEEASTLLKRDIVFAASLYTE